MFTTPRIESPNVVIFSGKHLPRSCFDEPPGSLAVMRTEGSIPPELRPSHFWDLVRYPFAHQSLICDSRDVIEVIENIHSYCESWFRLDAPKAHSWLCCPDSEGRGRSNRNHVGVPLAEFCLRYNLAVLPKVLTRTVRPYDGCRIAPAVDSKRIEAESKLMTTRSAAAAADRALDPVVAWMELQRTGTDFVFNPECIIGRAGSSDDDDAPILYIAPDVKVYPIEEQL